MQLPGARKKGDQIVEAGAMLVMVAGAPAIYGRQVLYFLDDVLVDRSGMEVAPSKPRLLAERGDNEEPDCDNATRTEATASRCPAINGQRETQE